MTTVNTALQHSTFIDHTGKDNARPSAFEAQRLSTASTTNNRPPRPNALSASLTHGWRALLKLKHVPSQLLDVNVWPILMTLMFTYIFGGAVAGSVTSYLQHLIPGMFVLAVAMNSQYTAIGLNRDIENGIFDRFRSLSFWRPAALVGALFGDVIRYTMAAVVVTVLGLILGFRPEAGPIGVLSSLGVVLVFAFSLSWIWTTIGLLIDRPETVSMVTGIVNFPLLFISNVFVEPETMPALLEQYVKFNPFGLTVTAVRGLMHGNGNMMQIAYMFLACAVLVAIFAPITMHLYNNKHSS